MSQRGHGGPTIADGPPSVLDEPTVEDAVPTLLSMDGLTDSQRIEDIDKTLHNDEGGTTLPFGSEASPAPEGTSPARDLVTVPAPPIRQGISQKSQKPTQADDSQHSPFPEPGADETWRHGATKGEAPVFPSITERLNLPAVEQALAQIGEERKKTEEVALKKGLSTTVKISIVLGIALLFVVSGAALLFAFWDSVSSLLGAESEVPPPPPLTVPTMPPQAEPSAVADASPSSESETSSQSALPSAALSRRPGDVSATPLATTACVALTACCFTAREVSHFRPHCQAVDRQMSAGSLDERECQHQLQQIRTAALTAGEGLPPTCAWGDPALRPVPQ